MTSKRSKKSSTKLSSLTTLVNLQPEEILHLAKPREGYQAFVEPMIAVFRDHGDEIRITGRTPDDALATYQALQTLQQMEAADEQHTAKVRASRALRESENYTDVLDIYARAKVAARDNAEIRQAISGFERFMKNGTRKKPAPQPTPPITTDALVQK